MNKKFKSIQSKVKEYRKMIQNLGNRLNLHESLEGLPNCEGTSYSVIAETEPEENNNTTSSLQNLFKLNYSSKFLLTPITSKCATGTALSTSTPRISKDLLHPSMAVSSASSTISESDFVLKIKHRDVDLERLILQLDEIIEELREIKQLIRNRD